MEVKKFVLVSTLTLAALPLHAAVFVGDVVGTEETTIRAALESSGYIVQSIEIENDEIEVETSLDGSVFEIELSATTGAVLEIEADDDDND